MAPRREPSIRSVYSPEERRSQLIHVTSPSFSGNGAVPPLPFLPLPPEEAPKQPTYAATPRQPRRQPSQGYIPGALPSHVYRSFSPTTSESPTFPPSPTVTDSSIHSPRVHDASDTSHGGSIAPPRSNKDYELDDLGSMSLHDVIRFHTSSPLSFQSRSLDVVDADSEMTSARDSMWSNTFATSRNTEADQPTTTITEDLNLSRFSRTTSVALEKRNTSSIAALSNSNSNQGKMGFGSSRGGLNRFNSVRDSATVAIMPKAETIRSGKSSTTEGGGRGRRWCWIFFGFVIIALIAALAGCLGWYFGVFKKSQAASRKEILSVSTITMVPGTNGDQKANSTYVPPVTGDHLFTAPSTTSSGPTRTTQAPAVVHKEENVVPVKPTDPPKSIAKSSDPSGTTNGIGEMKQQKQIKIDTTTGSTTLNTHESSPLKQDDSARDTSGEKKSGPRSNVPNSTNGDDWIRNHQADISTSDTISIQKKNQPEKSHHKRSIGSISNRHCHSA